MKLRRLMLLCGLLSLTAGCGGGGPSLATVSGQVKVDGKPYPNAYVMFQPKGTPGNPNPGRGSMAITDNEGRFSLGYENGRQGAVVGVHVVRISSVQPADDPSRFKDTEKTGSPDGEDPTGANVARGFKPEPIPASWNTDSTKEFEVPPGGTTTADFNIDSIQALKKK